MKAIVNTQYGSPEVLKLEEVEKPIPNANEVLIKVIATTVNRTDCGFLRGKPRIVRLFSGLTKPKNTILGNEFAGTIEAVGKNVTLFKVGDNVFGYSEPNFGAHAEYMTLRENGMITTMPENLLSHEEITPSTEGAHYALNDICKGNVSKGQNVLINCATGAIGSAAVQICKYFEANVTAICSTQHVGLIKSLGADTVIDYIKEDFTSLDEKFDFIFDAVGKSSFGICKKLLNTNGIYCSTEFGPFPQNPILAVWTSFLVVKKLSSLSPEKPKRI